MLKQIIFSKFKVHDFYADFVIRRQQSPIFDSINFKTDQAAYQDFDSVKENVDTRYSAHYITYIPTYFIQVKLDKSLKAIPFNRFVGFCINMEGFDSTEGYISKQFGVKSRSKVRSYVRRLETCFNVSYDMYHGDNLSRGVYDSLFEILEEMITMRFNQRNDTHQAMGDWDYYKSSTYNLIKDKKASLFVIYDDEKPIDICLNYHEHGVFVNHIRAYDIDYSKFRLGYIDIYKQLDWCIENNYKIFDLGSGTLTYKEQWCNVTYEFQNLIVYNKKSLRNIIFGNLMASLYKLKNFLNSKNIISDTEVNKSYNSGVKNDNEDETKHIDFDTMPLEDGKVPNNSIKIDIEHEDYQHLRHAVYDYLYLNFESKKDIVIYKWNNTNDETYILKGSKGIIKLFPKEQP